MEGIVYVCIDLHIARLNIVQAACLPEAVKAGVRVTVDMGSEASFATSALSGEKLYSAKLAKLSDPKQKLGLYWGYQTRIASSMRELLQGGPFEVGLCMDVRYAC